MLGVRPAADAVVAERGPQPGDVRGGAQRGIDLHGTGDRRPRLAAVASADEVRGRRLQRLGLHQRPAGLVITLRGREQAGGVVVQQAVAIDRIRLPVRDLRSGGQGGGLACEGLRGAGSSVAVASADGVGQQVLDFLEFFGIAVERVGQRGQCL